MFSSLPIGDAYTRITNRGPLRRETVLSFGGGSKYWSTVIPSLTTCLLFIRGVHFGNFVPGNPVVRGIPKLAEFWRSNHGWLELA